MQKTKPVLTIVKPNGQIATRARIAAGCECPNCAGGEANIEDNGCTGDDLTYLCTACMHQWDRVNYLPDAGGANVRAHWSDE